MQQGKKFTWVQTRLEILKNLTDVMLTARFLVLSRLKRQNGAIAKLWISQVMTRRARLENSKLPALVKLPESLYLELTVGQMSEQVTTVFECPASVVTLMKRTNRDIISEPWTSSKRISRSSLSKMRPSLPPSIPPGTKAPVHPTPNAN